MPILTGWPTDAGDGSVSTEERWRKMAQLWAPSGVVDGYLDRLDPDLSGSTVTVGPGGAWIDGHYAEQLTSSSVSVTSNGLVVIRFTPADNVFELLYRDGATSPTQTDATWELPLAQMSGGAMTDLREFVTRGRVNTSALENGAVTTIKLADLAVTTGKIDNEAVTAAKMAGGAVTNFIQLGGQQNDSNTGLGGAMTAVVTQTFTKPDDWVTYEMSVWGAAAIINATASDTVEVRVVAGINNGNIRTVVLGGGTGSVEASTRHRFTGLNSDTQEVTVEVRRGTGTTANADSAWVQYLALRST